MLLRTELEGLRLIVHTVQYGYALQMIARLAQDASTLLLSLLYGDAYSGDRSTSLLHNVDKGESRLSIGQKVIHNEHLILSIEVGTRHEDVVHALVSEAVGMGDILVIGAVGRFALLGKHHRHVVEVAQQHSDGYSTGLDSENLSDRLAAETALELVCDLPHNVDVDLMVEEVIHLQDVSGLDGTLIHNLLLKEIHKATALFLMHL